MNRADGRTWTRQKAEQPQNKCPTKIIQLQDERRRDSRGKISKTTMLRLQRDIEETRNLMEKDSEGIQKC